MDLLLILGLENPIAVAVVEWILSKCSLFVQSMVGAQLIILSIVWFFMRNKMARGLKTITSGYAKMDEKLTKHMESVEKGLKGITESLDATQKAFVSLEHTHSQRLSGLETGVRDLTDRVGKLEKTNTTSKE